MRMGLECGACLAWSASVHSATPSLELDQRQCAEGKGLSSPDALCAIAVIVIQLHFVN